MRGRAAVAAVLLFFAVAVHADPERGAVDWIFLVDTSASMKKNDVFSEVQKSLKTFVSEASEGDSVAIVTFDRDVRLRTSTPVKADRRDLNEIIDGLEFEGKRTHLGAAIAAGLEREQPHPQRTSAIVLFTDGLEDVRGIENPVSIPSNLARAMKSDALIFFVSMDEHEPQLRAFDKAEFIEANDKEAIRGIAERIRKKVIPPPLPPVAVTVTPLQLDFGTLEPGQTTEVREIKVRSNRDTAIIVNLEATPHLAMKPHDILAKANVDYTVKLQLDVAEDAKAEPRRIAFKVANGPPVGATLTIKKPALIKRLAPWIALFVTIAAIALWLRKRHIDGHQLEGELEIVKPHVGSDASYVGLPMLKLTELPLSTIVPQDALNGSDARLYVRRKDGAKKVCIESTSGALRVNSIEVPATELYDADTIQIGDATLRFNRVGHERPQEEL